MMVCSAGLYYDGNNGLWYSYDQQTQKYIPCTDENGKTAEKQSDGSNNRKVIISAPAATVTSNEKAASLPDAVQAAAAAAIAAEKKEKEKLKEIRLASKSSIMANKKKMNNVLSMWKQRSNEGQAPRVALEDNQPSASIDERSNPASSMKSKLKNEGPTTKENVVTAAGLTSAPTQSAGLEPQDRAKPISTSSSGTLKGVIRSSGMGVVKSNTVYMAPEGASAPSFNTSSAVSSSLTYTESSSPVTPFRTDASALGGYAPSAVGSGKRRFSEMPSTSVTNKEQSQTTYRDRAAERRSLYGSSSAFGENDSNAGSGDSSKLSLILGCMLLFI